MIKAPPPELFEAALGGRLVPILGEGLNAGTANGGLATPPEILAKLARDYPDYVDRSEAERVLPRVAAWYELTKQRHRLIESLSEWYSDASATPTPAQHLSVSVAGPALMSLGWGHAVENAIKRSERPYNRCVRRADIAYTNDSRLLYIKLLGCIDQKDSILITDVESRRMFGSDHADLGAIISPLVLRNTLLLLGIPLYSPFLDALYAYRQAAHPHVATAYIVDPRPSRAATAIWEDRGFIVLSGEPTMLLTQLAARTPLFPSRPQKRAAPPRPVEPYKFLDYYSSSDSAIFFGRVGETERLLSSTLVNPITVVVGPSGVGKTSLLLAGLLPRLAEYGCNTHVVRALDDPVAALGRAVTALPTDERPLHEILESLTSASAIEVFAIDQFEEFFLRVSPSARRAFAQTLRDCIQSSTHSFHFVLVLREDFLHRLWELEPPLDSLLSNRIRLRRFDEQAARDAIRRPAELFNFDVEEAFVTCLLKDLDEGDGSIEPAHLQVVCFEILRRAEGAGLQLSQYRELGGASEILSTYLDRILAELETGEVREAALAILKAMVTDVKTKAAVTAQEITDDAISRRLGLDQDRLERTLAALVKHRVVRPLLGRTGYFEISHETLVRKIWTWLEPEEIRFKYWRRTLIQIVGDHRQWQLLPTQLQWRELNAQREVSVLGAEDAAVMCDICLLLGDEEDCDYWLARAEKTGFDVWSAISETIANGALDARIRATHWAGTKNDVNRVVALRAALCGPYEAVRRQAIRATEALAPDESARVREGYTVPAAFVLIPAGEFTLGSEDPRFPDSHPSRRISLSSFWIQRFPVTNAEYYEYVRECGVAPPKHWGGDRPPVFRSDHPVVEVTWHDAEAYAGWYSKKWRVTARLPTIAEWEKAGGWNLATRQAFVWSWGNEYSAELGNTRIGGPGRTTAIGAYSPAGGDSPYGVVDMSGNTFDWAQDWWCSGYGQYEAADPQGPADTGVKAARGGSWAGSAEGAAVVSHKYYLAPTTQNEYVGFRLAISVTEDGGIANELPQRGQA